MNVRLLSEVYVDVRGYHHAIDVTGYRPLRLPRFTAVIYYTIESGEIVVAGVMVGGRSSANLPDRR